MSVNDKRIKYFVSKADARDAFLTDVQMHRRLIEKAFDVYGKILCNAAKADEEVVEERVLVHDLTKINEEVESTGLMAYYYQYPMKNLDFDSPRRRYLFQKSILNHYHMNSNHPEHWLKYHDNVLIAVEMDPESVVEMILDWIAIEWEGGERLTTEAYWDEVRTRKLFNENTIKLVDHLIDIYKKIPRPEINKEDYK